MSLINTAYRSGQLNEIDLILKEIKNNKHICTNCSLKKYLYKKLKDRLKYIERYNLKININHLIRNKGGKR